MRQVRGPLLIPLVAVVLLALESSSGRQQAATQEQRGVVLTVAAAADLTPAFREIGDRFTEQSSVKIDFTFGSTGQLAQQIEAGAPIDMFAAANVGYINQLEAKGLIVPDTKALYARGRIVMWTLRDSPLHIDEITDLLQPEVRGIAIANPDHAPYGVAAREALRAAGVWDEVQPRLVLGENVRDTLRYAETGNVDVAIVALSLAIQGDGRWILIPDDLYEPIDQALAVIRGTQHEAEARAFAAFINSAEGRSVMRRYGFVLPGEQIPVGTPGVGAIGATAASGATPAA